MSPDKLSASSESGWIGGAEEPSETKQRLCMSVRAVRSSVFGKMLANKTAPLCESYLQYNKVLVTKCTSML